MFSPNERNQHQYERNGELLYTGSRWTNQPPGTNILWTNWTNGGLYIVSLILQILKHFFIHFNIQQSELFNKCTLRPLQGKGRFQQTYIKQIHIRTTSNQNHSMYGNYSISYTAISKGQAFFCVNLFFVDQVWPRKVDPMKNAWLCRNTRK